MARVGQLVWIAIALLLISLGIIAVNTAANRWSIQNWRLLGRKKPPLKFWLRDAHSQVSTITMGQASGAHAVAILGSVEAIMKESDFLVFSRGFVILLFVSFLLPIWTLSFSTAVFGTEREDQTLLWLLTRPLPRWSLYLGRYLALIPWSVGFSLLGFYVLCLTAGRPGLIAFQLFWPAIFWSALAFTSLFMLMGAFLKRPAVIAIVYSFFLEVLAGNMPGSFKRISIGFYSRCIMFEKAETLGLQPENPLIYEPVSASTAILVLSLFSLALLVIGMILFERKQLEGAE